MRLSRNRFHRSVLGALLRGDNVALVVYLIDDAAAVGFDEWLRLAPFAVTIIFDKS